MPAAARISEFLARQQDAEQRFLAELVRVPSDNPPGDCAPHAERAATLLEGLGLTVERHPVPEAAGARARHASARPTSWSGAASARAR